MLGELPLASRRNLLGLWNQTFPELEIGLLSILTLFSSWKSDWSCGAAARFSRMRPSSAFRSAGERGSARSAAGDKSKSKRKRNRLGFFRFFDAWLQRSFAPGLGFSRSRRG